MKVEAVNKMNKIFSLYNHKWDYTATGCTGCFIGGYWNLTTNSAQGFQGLLKQWWEYYVPPGNSKVLLVSENNETKKEFNKLYSNWIIDTLELYNIEEQPCDIVADICNKGFSIKNKYDTIICSSLLEHTYNPFEAMYNMCSVLNKNGYIFIHTAAQAYGYHQWPRDYMRFMIDWWYDLPNYINNIKLIEVYQIDNPGFVFVVYQKYKNETKKFNIG
jgi:SAM-dependent methyltransferase